MNRRERNRQRMFERAYRERRERRQAGLELDYRAGRERAQPTRITHALDSLALYGPEVDRACLAEEPAVDRWEAGEAAPSWEQLLALVELTGYPVEFFLRPFPDTFGAATMCGSGGCHVVEPPPVVEPYRPPAPLVRLYPDTLF